MRKFSTFLAFFLLAIFAAVVITWKNRENILAHFLSKQLHAPVAIHSLNIDNASAEMTHLWIGNPMHSKTATAFAAEALKTVARLDQLLSNPLTIENITIDNIFVGIEFYDQKGEDNNWSRILHEDTIKNNTRDYLIQTLTLRNLVVELTQADGKIKRYPEIQEIEFHNITSETGFPIEEIEKAIFDLLMQNLFKKLQLNELIKTIVPFSLSH